MMSKIHDLECKYNVLIQPGGKPLKFKVSGTITGWGNPQDGEIYSEVAPSLCELETTCKKVRSIVNVRSN
jgi:hypothetical protein